MKLMKHYAVADGKPLGLGLRDIFGYATGVLIPTEPTSIFVGYLAKKRLEKLILRTIECQRKLRESVVFDWVQIKPLTTLGSISIVSYHDDWKATDSTDDNSTDDSS